MKKLRGFSLIELIVSIIIVGLSVSAITAFLNTIKTTSKTSIKEEVFFAEFSLLNLISTKFFDENNSVGENFYKVLKANGDSELDVIDYGLELNRIGKHQMDNNIFRSGSDLKVSKIGKDKDEVDVESFDDVDDFNGYSETIYGVSSGGYRLNVEVKYIKDSAVYSNKSINFVYDFDTLTNNSNIKLVRITSNIDNKDIILEYPVCNIGATKILSLEEIKE